MYEVVVVIVAFALNPSSQEEKFVKRSFRNQNEHQACDNKRLFLCPGLRARSLTYISLASICKESPLPSFLLYLLQLCFFSTLLYVLLLIFKPKKFDKICC